MRVASLPLVLQAVLLSIVFPAAGDSAEMDRTAFHRHRHHTHVSETGRTMFRGQSLEAKIHFCSECHGRLGQGYGGYYTIPQLAGQQLPYIQNQFKAIHERVRDDPLVAKIMWPYLRDLDPGIWSGLAEHFSALPPTAHPGGPKNLVAELRQDHSSCRSIESRISSILRRAPLCLRQAPRVLCRLRVSCRS